MSLSWKLGLAALIVVLASGLLVEAQLLSQFTENPCVHKLNCRECIHTAGCGWCTKPDLGDVKRCFQPSVQKNLCPEPFIYYPENYMRIIKNVTLSSISSRAAMSSGQRGGYGMSYAQNSSSGSSYSAYSESEMRNSIHGQASSQSKSKSFASASGSQKFVQIYPQHVSIKLRLNEPYNLSLQYARAEDYPIDLYYLMDLSQSMKDDKDKLSSLGDLLSSKMKEITSNFRLGFGSFVDKVLMPFVSTIPEKLKSPCTGCAAPYGFRNHMSLSNDTNLFTNEVKSVPVSGNLDSPEGGFDAIMQAVVCRDAIGWREQTRHLLVFSTDAGFHYAGDGKLAGIIEPNDGRCHLDKAGEYTYSTHQDYPSISQINHKVKENSINIIFAVTAPQIDIYQKLSTYIQGSSSAVLSNDSSNVVDIVREAYNKISSSIEMKDTASSYVNITYYSSCLTNGPAYATSKCDEVKLGDVVYFTAEILLTACPPNPKDWNPTIQIYPVGIDERLTVNLEMLCSCDCEKKGSNGYEEFSPKCNGTGTLMCGVCECDSMHVGKHCECSIDDMNQKSQKGCIPPNSTDTRVCNGLGNCECGQCKCFPRADPEEIIQGEYCQCNNFSCERTGGKICSGNGYCECGECKCNENWTGDSCNCLSTTDSCKAPGSDRICSGRGECHCGKCVCATNGTERYYGNYCERCPDCTKRCDDLKDCVQCQMYNTGPLKDNCMASCSTFTPKAVPVVEVLQDEIKCSFYDEDDCKFVFKYTEVNGVLEVTAQEVPDCPHKVFMLGIVLGVVAAIVLIGLAILLLWKLLTTIHDRREFARFEKERMNAKWDTGENPIYKQATSTFKNPMYAGK